MCGCFDQRLTLNKLELLISVLKCTETRWKAIQYVTYNLSFLFHLIDIAKKSNNEAIIIKELDRLMAHLNCLGFSFFLYILTFLRMTILWHMG